MGKGGGGRGRKVNHGRGSKFGSMEEFMERNADEQNSPKNGQAKDGSDEESVDEETSRQKKAPVFERDDELEAELNKQFGDESGLTRRQREELEAQEAKRQEEKAKKEGKTDEAAADMERLKEIRRQREEAAVKRKEQESAEAEQKAAAQAQKSASNDRQREVATQVAKLVQAATDMKMTLNQLNQDPGCKKVLKPLCKKEGVKAINKAWLSQFPDILVLKDEGKDLVITAKGC